MRQALQRRARRLVRGHRDANASLLRAAYLVLLKREPDAPGLDRHLERLDAGDSWLSILTSFVRSDEFAALHARDPASPHAVVRAAYRSVLWRDPPQEALDWYTAQLAGGLSVAELVDVLSELDDVPTVAAAIDEHRRRRAAAEREHRALANRIAALESHIQTTSDVHAT